MHKVLYILGQLSEQDVDWLITHGRVQHLVASEILIRERQHPDALYIVLAGQLAILAGQKQLAVRSVGEVLGEMSFIDRRPPVATVKVLDKATVLAVPRDKLSQKLAEDTAFASRFYLALGTFMSLRLREMDMQVAGSTEEDDELDLNEMQKFDLAANRFDRLLKQLNEKA